jgi:streptomycin 6-kinase
VGDAWRDPAWRARMVRRFGPDVEAWCDDVPRLAGEPAARWELHDLQPVAASGTSRVVATDTAAGALLLEAIEPGTQLADVPQAATVEAVAGLTAALHVTPPAGLPALRDRVDFVFAVTRTRARGTRVGADVIERSHAAARALADDHGGPAVLLHGDLHLSNVLVGPPGRELVAIDPRACVGDPAFDLIDWITDCAAPPEWTERSHALAMSAGVAPARRWRRLGALAVVIAAARLRGSRRDDELAARLLALAP